MIEIYKKLQDKSRLAVFPAKSFLNGNEAWFLTIKYDGIHHVFYYKDIIWASTNNSSIADSKAMHTSQFNNQKALPKINGVNAGELEVLNDSEFHYNEINFYLNKHKILPCCNQKSHLPIRHLAINNTNVNQRVIRYAQAIKRFR
ncbi:MAG: hypothetical protein LBT81_05565 [Helicobacteraceae bacterium]|jgi:hypothetical protein|nr:hypothetical protein [Helicobacteraceae bacterium]